jgi:hypothetical protein
MLGEASNSVRSFPTGLTTMPEPTDKLTDVQFAILDAMADDSEDIERIYLAANDEYFKGERLNFKYLLHTLIDELVERRIYRAEIFQR